MRSVLWNFDLLPDSQLHVEKPQVVKVCEVFSSENNKILIDDFGNMIGSLPGLVFVILGFEFDPFLGGPVECENGVEPFLPLSTASEQH